MTIKVKLPDPLNCVGCPFLEGSDISGNGKLFRCDNAFKHINGYSIKNYVRYRKFNNIKRPQECIDTHGK